MVFEIIFIVAYTIEILDKEGNSLGKQRDEYYVFLDEAIDLINKYIDNGVLTPEAFLNYQRELHKIPSSEKVIKNNERLKKERKERYQKSEDFFVSFTGELIICLFVLTLFFIVISLIEKSLSLYIPWLVVLIIALSFSDFTVWLEKNISKIARILTKKRKIFKK